MTSKGFVWYNNGSEERTFSSEQNIPEGFTKGKLKRIWITNGTVDKKILSTEDIPEGFSRGRKNGCSGLNKSGKIAFSNGKQQIFLSEGENIPKGFVKGGLSFSEEHKEKISKKLKQHKRTEEHKEKLKQVLSTEEHKEKLKQTFIDKYGVENPALIKDFSKKATETMLKKYGVEHYAQTGLNRPGKYIFDNLKFDSSWELYYYIYNKYILKKEIKRETKKIIFTFKNEEHIYIPDFEIDGKFIEIKGKQFFDNGKMINPFDRSQDELFEAKHQCMISNNVNIITDITEIKEIVDKKFTKDFVFLFKKDLPFPYLNEDLSDTSDMGLVHHFHKSIYEAYREGKNSPLQAWENKELVKKAALNRLKYANKCSPNDIIQGFNVAKIAPKVSVFKPTLATKLIQKYLDNANVIVDPFSGFSGRMLGALNCKKQYLGFDINEDHVRESNEIIDYKKTGDMCSVEVQDLISTPVKNWEHLEDVCLFTCPPYNSKEHWAEGEALKSCDEWIDLCLEKHKGCKKYLFVVDETEKYKNFIVDTIDNKSHFGYNSEKVILITRGNNEDCRNYRR